MRLPAILLTVLTVSAAMAGEPKLSSSRVPAEEIGDDWVASEGGIVIDDLDSPPQEPQQLKEVAAALQKQLQPLGVKAAADFTYHQKSGPIDSVTVRVFLFKTEDQRREWMEKKYRFEGWEKKYKYKKAEVNGCEAYDSLEMSKRIVGFDRVLLTSGTVGKTDLHLKALGLYLDRLKKALKETSGDEPGEQKDPIASDD